MARYKFRIVLYCHKTFHLTAVLYVRALCQCPAYREE